MDSMSDLGGDSQETLQYSGSGNSPSRPESFIGFPRPPLSLSRPNGNRTLSDLHAESPPGTPNFSKPKPWGRPESSTTLASPYSATPSPYASTEAFKSLIPGHQSPTPEKDQSSHIITLNPRDDWNHMPTWKRRLFLLAPFLCVLTLVSYWVYFVLRILFVVDAQQKNGESFPMAWVFIGTEISVAVPLFIQTLWNVFILKRRKRAQLRLEGDDVPSVDCFITCCKEEVDVIMDTTRAACEVDWPIDKFRVIVLDDGGDPMLREAVQNLGHVYPNLWYRARTKIPGVPHHFKAGNLNYGLDEVHNMPGGASRFMAALDADMIPEKHWLRALMPHLLIDDKCAMACPPQLFYNVPKGDPLAQSLDFFVHICEPIKDALGVAWCTGSGYIFRRTAIDDIGGFPKGSLAEDVATSTNMLGKGWNTAYIHEPLQFGTVPDSYGSHLKQRTRWAIGTVDTAFKLKFCLYGDHIKHMKFFPRLSGFLFALLSLYNIPLMLSLFALPIVLVSGMPLIAYANDDQLRWLIRACFATVLINRICEIVLYLPAGYATGQRGARTQLWMAPYISLSIIRSFFLPKWLGGAVQNFQPTGSIKSDLNERDPVLRAGLVRRIYTIMFNYLGIYHVIYVYFVLAAVSLSSSRCVAENARVYDKLLCLLTHAFWPPAAWIIVCSAFWIPMAYAIDPPNMPPREDLLEIDPKTGVKRPTEKAKAIGWGFRDATGELENTFTTAFTALIFVAAFFY